MWSLILPFVFKIGAKLFTGGSLNTILATIDKHVENQVTRDQLQADVTKTWINAQANLLVGRTWWFQLLFVIPLGIWWSAVILDTIFQIPGWDVASLPAPLDQWATWIVSALFIVDGSKALIGRVFGGK
jgi:hypothetical protein